MKAILQRDHAASDLVTFGKLYLPWIQKHPDLYTIELLWKDNKPNISCIPVGTYNLIGHQGVQHRDVWELQNVPGHTGILIHVGNYACKVSGHKSNTNGCILVGFGIEERIPMITNSGRAIEYLRATWGIKGQGQPMNIQLEVRN